MIEVFPLTSNLLEEIIHVADRNSLDFPEYNFLSDEELKAYFHSTLSNNLTDIKGSYTLVAVECNSPLGLININKNDFDSQFFDFPCYQLHLYIFSRKDREIEKIISLLIKNAESKVRNESDIFHFSIGLNNNSVNNQQLFNCLIQNGF